jgi:hypothetical protein
MKCKGVIENECYPALLTISSGHTPGVRRGSDADGGVVARAADCGVQTPRSTGISRRQQLSSIRKRR